MKRWAGLILLALGAWILPVSAGDKGEDKKELGQFQGTWAWESMIENGKSIPAEELKGLTLIIKGNDWSVMKDGKKLGTGTFTINAAKKTIDRKDLEGSDKGKSFSGIYEIKGDTLKTCWAAAGKERPTALESKEGSDWELDVLKRVKK
jgi:uncharacterized protein (TIGR03067 family)